MRSRFSLDQNITTQACACGKWQNYYIELIHRAGIKFNPIMAKKLIRLCHLILPRHILFRYKCKVKSYSYQDF